MPIKEYVDKENKEKKEDEVLRIKIPAAYLESANNEVDKITHQPIRPEWNDWLHVTREEFAEIIRSAIEKEPVLRQWLMSILTKEPEQGYLDLITAQLQKITPDTEGLLVIKYGSPEYIISAQIADKIANKLDNSGALEKFSKIVPFYVPWYMDFELFDLKDYKEDKNGD